MKCNRKDGTDEVWYLLSLTKTLKNDIPHIALVLTDWNSGEQYQKSSSLKTIIWVKCQHCHVTSHINVAASLHTTVHFKSFVLFICYFQIITSKREKYTLYLTHPTWHTKEQPTKQINKPTIAQTITQTRK